MQLGVASGVELDQIFETCRRFIVSSSQELLIGVNTHIRLFTESCAIIIICSSNAKFMGNELRNAKVADACRRGLDTLKDFFCHPSTKSLQTTGDNDSTAQDREPLVSVAHYFFFAAARALSYAAQTDDVFAFDEEASAFAASIWRNHYKDPDIKCVRSAITIICLFTEKDDLRHFPLELLVANLFKEFRGNEERIAGSFTKVFHRIVSECNDGHLSTGIALLLAFFKYISDRRFKEGCCEKIRDALLRQGMIKHVIEFLLAYDARFHRRCGADWMTYGRAVDFLVNNFTSSVRGAPYLKSALHNNLLLLSHFPKGIRRSFPHFMKNTFDVLRSIIAVHARRKSILEVVFSALKRTLREHGHDGNDWSNLLWAMLPGLVLKYVRESGYDLIRVLCFNVSNPGFCLFVDSTQA